MGGAQRDDLRLTLRKRRKRERIGKKVFNLPLALSSSPFLPGRSIIWHFLLLLLPPPERTDKNWREMMSREGGGEDGAPIVSQMAFCSSSFLPFFGEDVGRRYRLFFLGSAVGAGEGLFSTLFLWYSTFAEYGNHSRSLVLPLSSIPFPLSAAVEEEEEEEQ